MIGQSCLAKHQTRAQPIRITGIDSAQRRRQKEVSTCFTNHAPAPIGDGFQRARPQAGGAPGKPETYFQDFRGAKWKPFWPATKNESRSSFASRSLQRQANVRAHFFEAF